MLKESSGGQHLKIFTGNILRKPKHLSDGIYILRGLPI